jgi:hypothetical protein
VYKELNKVLYLLFRKIYLYLEKKNLFFLYSIYLLIKMIFSEILNICGELSLILFNNRSDRTITHFVIIFKI